LRERHRVDEDEANNKLNGIGDAPDNA
jgi:hypothetical protein